jgi:hypothetical protein
LLDEFDQPFEHLGLAGEVAVERRFRNVKFCSQSGGGDLFTLGDSSMFARASRICCFLSPGLMAMIFL